MEPSKITYYYPQTPEDTEAAGLDPAIEGGTQGSGPFSDLDLRKHTLEAYHRGESPFVAVAMKDGLPYGSKFPLKLGDKEVPAMVVDTGGGLAPGQVDVATENPQLAMSGGSGHSSRASRIPIAQSIIDSPMAAIPDVPMVPLDVPGSGEIPDIGSAPPETPEDIQSAIEQYPKIAGQPTEESIAAASPDETPEDTTEPTSTEMSTPTPSEQPQEAPPIGKLTKLPQVDHVDNEKGIAYFKNGWMKDLNSGAIYKPDPVGNVWMYTAGNPKGVKIKNATTGTVHPAIMNQLVQYGAPVTNENGEPYSSDAEAAKALAKFQKDNGILNKAQQHIADQVTNKINSGRNPYIRPYLQIQGNFESALANLQKPNRNGIDDALLLSSYYGIERPGYAPTELDYRNLMRSMGIRGNIEVQAKRIKALISGDTNDQGRVIPDEVLPQMEHALFNAVAPRLKMYNEGVQPFRSQLEKAGINPDDYLPNLRPPSAPGGAASVNSIPVVTNQAAFDALPPGAKFKEADGQVRTKPY